MALDGETCRGGVIHADPAGLAAAAADADGIHVALLAERTVDEWYRLLEGAGRIPRRQHLVQVTETVRSAATVAAPSTRALGGGTYVTTLERPVDGRLPDVLRDPLADAGDDGGSLVVDDPSFLLEDADDPDAALSALIAAAADAGTTVHVGVSDSDETTAALARKLTPADGETLERVVRAGLANLREVDPTNFGYLRRHWREAHRGLEAVGMTYPQAKQIHAAIPSPETTPRTLGATLQALVTLGALDVWGETVAANRYDLTGYDPERVAAVGAAIESLAE